MIGSRYSAQSAHFVRDFCGIDYILTTAASSLSLQYAFVCITCGWVSCTLGARLCSIMHACTLMFRRCCARRWEESHKCLLTEKWCVGVIHEETRYGRHHEHWRWEHTKLLDVLSWDVSHEMFLTPKPHEVRRLGIMSLIEAKVAHFFHVHLWMLLESDPWMVVLHDFTDWFGRVRRRNQEATKLGCHTFCLGKIDGRTSWKEYVYCLWSTLKVRFRKTW